MKARLLMLLAVGLFGGLGMQLPAADSDAVDNLPLGEGSEDADSPAQFTVTTWRTGEGLPVNEVQEIEETPDGYLWLGTHQGLVQFDGVRFQSLFEIPAGLRFGTRFGPLAVDAKDRLWVAPDETGLLYRGRNGFVEVLTNGATLTARVECLCSDGTNGMLWVDGNGTLGRIPLDKPGTSEPIKGGNASGGSKWMRDFDGNLWLVNVRGVRRYDSQGWHYANLQGSSTLVATPRRDGGLWIARDARLRFITADGKNEEVATFPWRGQSRVHCMTEDRQGRLWIGTVGQGLYCYDGGALNQVVRTASSINCLLEDSQDNLWVGTRGSGLIRIRPRQFFVLNLQSGLPNEYVRSLSQDSSGRMWLVTAEYGLGWWLNDAWHSLSEAEGWPRPDALAVYPSRDGGVWISTSHRGLWRWVDGKFIRKSLGPGGPRESAMDLMEDRRGRLWMVTDNTGIYCLETNRVTSYTTADGLPSGLIRRVVEDDAGEIWAGDWEGGIARFRGDRWELERAPSGHGDAVRSLVAEDGALWIGTSAGGLLRFKDGRTGRISTEQGLPDVSIRQLLLDGQGSLWAATPHRLYRLSLRELNAVLDGREARITPISYSRSDGLPDVSFASWCDPRCWRSTEGELWFATANGAVHFHPGRLREGKPPQAVLEQTLFNGKPVDLDKLRPGPGRLEFRFTAPCLTAPERVRFRYQLTGVDPGWLNADGRTAIYGSVPAGDHLFRVEASSPDGTWGSEPVSVALSVSPYFWQTNWFLAGIAAAIAACITWIVRRATVRRLSHRVDELRRQHAMDRERTRIAQDIHDELGANLTRIGLLADMGARHKQDSAALVRDLTQISQTARESVAAMDTIVWALNPRNDSLDHFANYLARYTREFFRPTDLRTRLDLPANLPPQPLAAETRHELFLLVKESFNNVVRHANASEVHLALACENGDLRLVIEDNGKGLPGENGGPRGNGLGNLRERIQRLGGTLEIDSGPGRGVKLDFVVPLAKLSHN